MTAWPGERVAGFAKQAGWRGSELVTAVAVALAASNGDDHVTVAVPPPPLVEYVGLWLVPAGELSGLTVADLLDPVTNAQAARRLWLVAGGDWGWNPSWHTGRWRWRQHEASQAVMRPRLFTAPSPLAGLRGALGAGAQLHSETDYRQNGGQ